MTVNDGSHKIGRMHAIYALADTFYVFKKQFAIQGNDICI